MNAVIWHRWFGTSKFALITVSMNAVTLACAGSIALLSSPAAIAQLTPDLTLGSEQSTVRNAGTRDLIEGGARRGSNLFHSFEQFNINNGQRLYFANPDGITNIISRVTGRTPSSLLGTLGVQGNAHLFLLNPNGIVFGRDARLDIKGSFVATSASSLRFSDGSEFKAAETTASPLLTVSVPVGLQFGANPGNIRVQGNGQGLRSNDAPEIDTNDALRVPSNQTLALVGGSIVSTGGTLKTAGGRLELGSISGTGFVKLIPSQKGFILDYDSPNAFGDIELLEATSIDASGRSGGDIQVQARQVILRGSSAIEATTLGNANSGSIKVVASDLVELSGSAVNNPQSQSRQSVTSISTDNRGAGTVPGELTINTTRLIIRNGARISASNTRNGVGGNININATDQVELIGTGFAPGGERSSGISVQTRGAGKAGELRIKTRQLSARAGAEVSASTFGSGNGGSIDIQAAEVGLSGTSAGGTLRSRLIAEAGVRDPDEGRRRNDTMPTTAVTGQGGDITVTTNQLTVQDKAAISVSSPAGRAGNLSIGAAAIVLDQGRLTAEAGVGSGANINLQGLDRFLLLKNNSLISAQAFADATGGNVTVNAANGFVVAVPGQNSDIIAIASQGKGGNISITTQGIFGIEQRLATSGNQTNDIDASSRFDQSGTVTINRPDVDPTQALIELPSEPRPQQPLASCQPGRSGSGRFVATGTGGLPTHPDEPLSSLGSLDDLDLPAQYRAEAPTPLIEEAQGWIISPKGEVTLVSRQLLALPCSSKN